VKAPPKLRTLIVVAEAADARFAKTVLEDHGDESAIAEGVPDALAMVAKEKFDLALVALSLPRGDGLALVHHLRALHNDVDVLVIAAAHEVEDIAHAMALGVIGSVMQPLTGDGILVPCDRARERRMLIQERLRLAQDEANSRKRNATYARCAAFVAETDFFAVATRVLDACVAEVPAVAGAIYGSDLAGGSRFVRAASTGEMGRLGTELPPEDIAALDISQVVTEKHGRVRIALVGDQEVPAVVDLVRPDGDTAPLREDQRESLQVIAALGSAAFSASRKVEGIQRGGIKDPETSAYTFAYFGDVAGREIDRATRHSRRFALLTLSLDGMDYLREVYPPSAMVDVRRAIADAILDAVRDSDVLARVEDDEFYLLLPETGLLGALACRRRIHTRIAKLHHDDRIGRGTTLVPAIGIGVYPSDGQNLGQLLRASRRRAERSRRGVWRRLGLASVPFWSAIDALLGGEDDAAIGRDGSIALHADLRRAHDETALARHAAVPRALVPHIAAAIAGDAVAHRVAGTIYAAGDRPMAAAIASAVDSAEGPPVRAWVLGQEGSPDAGGNGGAPDPASRIRLPVQDDRITGRVLLLALTELGGYVFVARAVGSAASPTLLAYHAADLDLVDGLVTSLQAAYHLQPEVR
jgi:diguanylate cyclase (GGDEF)-like protein